MIEAHFHQFLFADGEILADKFFNCRNQSASIQPIFLHEIWLRGAVRKSVVETKALEADTKPFFRKDFRDQRAEAADDGVVFQRDDTFLAARALRRPSLSKGFSVEA